MNDQHAFLRFDPSRPRYGSATWSGSGLSHPCTAFDKWTLIPVIDGAGDDPLVLDLVQTFF